MAEINQAAVDAALETLRAAPDALLKTRAAEIATVQTRAQTTDVLTGEAVADAAPEDIRLASCKAQYERWSAADKDRCPWAQVKGRLLANNSEDLHRAETMEGGAILFGADKHGNPLIVNGGPEPILTNMNYTNTRNAVRFTEKDGKQVPTGYEMLSDEEEIRAFEAFTGKPVVQPSEGFVPSSQDNGWRGIWRESGDNPDWARCAFVVPGGVRAYLGGDRDPQRHLPGSASGAC